jgi:hypothetical protein
VHGVPLDLGFLIFLSFATLFAWAVGTTDGSPVAWLVFTLSLLALIAVV